MHRHEKILEALRATAAQFIAREANPQSLITVTRVELSPDSKRGRIFITVYPESHETAALGFANRNRGEFSVFFKKKVRGVFPPRVEFFIDKGEKNRQHLDELSN